MTDVTFRNARMETGHLIIEIPPDQRGAVMHFLRSKKDKDYSLTIKEYRKKRSQDANSYAWVLINKIADVMRVPPVVVYKQAIQNVPDNNEILSVKEEAFQKFKEVWENKGLGWPCINMGKSKIPGCINVQAYYGSSTYDTRQFSILLDNLTQDCAALGIETMREDELESLLRSCK